MKKKEEKEEEKEINTNKKKEDKEEDVENLISKKFKDKKITKNKNLKKYCTKEQNKKINFENEK